MKKLLLLTPLLLACDLQVKDHNVAEVMVKGQIEAADCDSVVTPKRKIQISVCSLPSKEDIFAVYSKDHPFQAPPVKTKTQLKAEQDAAAKKAEAQKNATPTPPPPPAGSASGSGQ